MVVNVSAHLEIWLRRRGNEKEWGRERNGERERERRRSTRLRQMRLVNHAPLPGGATRRQRRCKGPSFAAPKVDDEGEVSSGRSLVHCLLVAAFRASSCTAEPPLAGLASAAHYRWRRERRSGSCAILRANIDALERNDGGNSNRDDYVDVCGGERQRRRLRNEKFERICQRGSHK